MPLVATAASRLSLHVELEAGARLENGAVLDEVDLDLDAGPVRLGRCRFDAEGGAARESVGDLVFLDDVYDCQSLVNDGQYVDLRGFFQNVPLVLAQRERIRPEFRQYCANLAYDLSIYKRFFDEQDAAIDGEPVLVAEAARDALRRTEGRRFMAFLDARLEELARVVRGYTTEEHQHHGYYLRRVIWPYTSGSTFLRYTNTKPRGYAGDCTSMQMAYENAYVGDGIFNQLLHKHPLETAAAEAVRNRLDLVVRVIQEARGSCPSVPLHGFRFLSLASGPAAEMVNLFLTREDAEVYHCAFLDQDQLALDMARATIEGIERRLHVRIDARYIGESVRTMLRARHFPDVAGRYQVVYSMGLFDYLTPPVARAVLAKAFELLAPGGTVLIGNYHVGNRTRLYMDYWMDWPLYYRTEESFLELAAGLPASSVRLEFDATGSQMFLRVERAKGATE